MDLPNAVSIGLGLAASMVIGLALAIVGVPPPVANLVGLAAFALVATELYYLAWPPRLRRAMAAHAFVGSPVLKRFRSSTGSNAPTSAKAAGTWLLSHPETEANRWARAELLAWTGDFDAAYEVIGRMPEATASERFERQSLEVLVDIVAGRGPDVDGLVAAADSVGEPGSEERLRAEASAAIERSRIRLMLGDASWLAPILEVQERIGARSLGLLRADTRAARFRTLAIVAAILFGAGAVPAWLIWGTLG